MADTVAANADIDATGVIGEAEASFIELFSGAALGATDAEVITRRSRTHLVAFVGAEGSGKTTLLASIYERLNLGVFAGFKFAGSRSLLGFEEICHLNRLASGGIHPDTQRTRLTDDARFYHLAIKSVEPMAVRRDVLISAMSGELFRMAKDSQEDAERLTFLRRADAIVVLVDGDRLATPSQRTSAQADATDILESLLDASMVSPSCRVEVVFSKLDRITAAGQTAQDVLFRTQEKFEGKFRTRVPHLSFRQVAARPDPSPAQEDMECGLAEAFVSWTTLLLIPADDENVRQPAPARDDREFSKFGWRHLERSRRDL